MIAGFDEAQFQSELKKYFTPAQPISNPDHLHGREAKLKLISRALGSPGKHVFIFGDRGIGKTSLAKSAYQIQAKSTDNVPIVACDNQSKFFDLFKSIHKHASLQNTANKSIQDIAHQPNTTDIASISSINDAVDALKEATRGSQDPSFVIVDEFDQLKGDENRKLFADLIKQVSDQEVNARFIICGIGRSLEELIGVHLSTDRYIAAVQLDPIPHDARWKILDAACEHFKVSLDKDSMIRIGQISDGFPYYIHLIGEKIFWEAFDDTDTVKAITHNHYQRGINGAIEESQTSLKQAYDQAVQKHGNSEDYEYVLWSIADGSTLQRQVSDIYEKSYIEIMNKRPEKRLLSKEIFYQRMNMLKKPTHGHIIFGNRQGWYGFSENIVRGYVRLRAERSGIPIGIDHIRG